MVGDRVAGRRDHERLLIAAGVNIKALSTYMGHASITITLDRYGHLFPGSEEEAAALVDAYLARVRSARRGDGSARIVSDCRGATVLNIGAPPSIRTLNPKVVGSIPTPPTPDRPGRVCTRRVRSCGTGGGVPPRIASIVPRIGLPAIIREAPLHRYRPSSSTNLELDDEEP